MPSCTLTPARNRHRRHVELSVPVISVAVAMLVSPAHALLPSYPEATAEGLRAFGAGFLPATNMVVALPPVPSSLFIESLRSLDPNAPAPNPTTSLCSGTMIASDLLLTAAHCLPVGPNMKYLGADASGRFGLYAPAYGTAIGVAQGLSNTLLPRLGAVERGAGATWKGDVEVVALPLPGVGPDLAIARVRGSAGAATFSRLAGANEQYSVINPASFGQPSGQMLGGALAVGYSVGNEWTERERRGGIPMIGPTTEPIVADRGYAAAAWVQRAEFVDAYAGSPLPGVASPTPTFGNYRLTSIRLVKGDSGGPLLLQSTTGRRVLAGVAFTAGRAEDYDAGDGPAGATWTDLRPHTALLSAMQSAVLAAPNTGESPSLGIKPVRIDAAGTALRSVFEAPTSTVVQWFDPPAGHAEELRMLSAHGFTAVDFGALQAPGARVFGRSSDSDPWQPLADASADDPAWTFVNAWRQLRIEGLGVAPGTDLTFGFAFESFELGARTVRFEWLGVDLLTPVPEPATLATLALGAVLVVAAARRHRAVTDG